VNNIDTIVFAKHRSLQHSVLVVLTNPVDSVFRMIYDSMSLCLVVEVLGISIWYIGVVVFPEQGGTTCVGEL
jgi:hypothetical protein